MRPVLWIAKAFECELAEVDSDRRLELALVDRAAFLATTYVCEDVVGVEKIVGDAALGHRFSDAAGIAIVRQARCDRRRRQAVGIVRQLISDGGRNAGKRHEQAHGGKTGRAACC